MRLVLLSVFVATSMLIASPAQAAYYWDDTYGWYWQETWADYCYPQAAYTGPGGPYCVDPRSDPNLAQLLDFIAAGGHD